MSSENFALFNNHSKQKHGIFVSSNSLRDYSDESTTKIIQLLQQQAFNWTNDHKSSYLENATTDFDTNFYELGPKRDSLNIVIPVTIIYSLIFITGVIGNISTCIVIKKNRSMHTATNYYLFSLAISDFLLLISGVPQEIFFIWMKYPYVFGEYFCIGRGILAETSANATVLTITSFTVERYMAICHPFLGQAMSKLSRAIRIIVLIWIISILTAVPQAAQFGIMIYNGVEKCTVVRDIIKHSFELSTFIFFFAPMSIILVLYLLIGLRLYRSSIIAGGGMGETFHKEANNGDGAISGKRSFTTLNGQTRMTTLRSSSGSAGRLGLKGTQSETMLYRYAGGTQLSAVRGRMSQYGTRRVLKMLVAVVICFFLCWAPFHAQRLIAIYGPNEIVDINGEQSDNADHHEIIYTVMTYISGVLYYLSTCINPLLYNLMSHKFREAFKAILFRSKLKSSMKLLHHTQKTRRLRRKTTMTSSTQRDSLESEFTTKNTLLKPSN